MKIKIDTIRTDGGTQSRAEMNQTVVEEYAEAIAGGAKFPPIVVFADGDAHWLADGFHRVAAARAAGRKTIEAEVLEGGQRDAVLYSVGANVSHGLRRTNEDKRRAVRVLLEDPEWSTWSDREIARRAGVGPDLVGTVRRSLSVNDSENQPNSAESQDSASERTYVTKHGAVARMNTSGIAARSAPRADPVPAESPAYEPPAAAPAIRPASPLSATAPKDFRVAQAEFRERLATRDAVHYRAFCTAVRRAVEATPPNVDAIRAAFVQLDANVDPYANGRQ